MRICLPFLLVLYVFLMAMPAQVQYSMGQAGSQLLGREVSLPGRMAHGSHTKRPQNCRRGSKVNTAEANCKGLIKGTRPSTYQFPEGSKVALPPGPRAGLQIDLPRAEPSHDDSNPTPLHRKRGSRRCNQEEGSGT